MRLPVRAAYRRLVSCGAAGLLVAWLWLLPAPGWTQAVPLGGNLTNTQTLTQIEAQKKQAPELLQEPVNEGTLEKPGEAEIDTGLESAPEEGAPGTEQPPADEQKIVLQELQVTGVTALTSEELTAKFDPWIGKKVGFSDLVKITDEVTELYKSKGYITTRAMLPPQEVKNGIVRIHVIEGQVGGFIVKDNKYVTTAYIRKRLHQKPGDIFKIQALENDIIALNVNPLFSRVKANLKPGEEIGTSDIEISAEDRFPVHLAASFNNTGRSNIGLYRSGLTLSHDNFFGRGDTLLGNYTQASGTQAVSVQYSMPFERFSLSGSYSYSRVFLPGPNSIIDGIIGRSHQFSLSANAPLYQDPKGRFSLSGDLSSSILDSMVFLESNHEILNILTSNRNRPWGKKLTSVTPGEEYAQSRNVTGGLTLSTQDKYGRTSLRTAMTTGLDWLGGNQSYMKWNADLTRLQTFGRGVVGVFRAQSQYTPNRLPGSEQMQLGGNNTVRGYSEGILTADKGYLLSAELRFPLYGAPAWLKDKVQGLVFYDHGGLWVSGPDNQRKLHGTAASGTSGFINGAGVGIRFQVTQHLTGRCDLGYVLGNPYEGISDFRVHFGLNANMF
ncbi:MAG: ShlB/FhaC/HecB family hemolysin secretion/activation protein [Candidatus Melainabacteria bacterium]